MNIFKIVILIILSSIIYYLTPEIISLFPDPTSIIKYFDRFFFFLLCKSLVYLYSVYLFIKILLTNKIRDLNINFTLPLLFGLGGVAIGIILNMPGVSIGGLLVYGSIGVLFSWTGSQVEISKI
jgi:hypothetical protein